MSNRVKRALALLVVVLLSSLKGYMAWKAAPALAAQYIAYNQTHPMSWLDFGLGVAMTAVTMMVLFVAISLRESLRFERAFEKGGGGDPPTGHDGGGAQKKIVRLPMSRKVVEIGDWRKVPTDGHIHRGAVPAPA
ncbi:MAG: hypothetical protein EXS47_00495 [Candidatus Zambryskibacteria bacterium]|nr:hypothetical protein [Candidatus Zambryskibacteria bacterium]